MDLAYTTEQDMLAESIQRFIATEYDLTTRKKLGCLRLGLQHAALANIC